MLDLPDDCLKYLFRCSSFGNIIPLFSTCNRLNVISDNYINDILKKDFRLLIRDNKLENIKKSYMSIYKIYGNKFILDKSKLQNLLNESIITNNMGLLQLLHKTSANSMKSTQTVFLLLKSALSIKSEMFFNYILEKHQIPNEEDIWEIVHYYYSNKINLPSILKKLFDKSKIYKEIIIMYSLNNNDLDIFKLLINQNELLGILNYVISEFSPFSKPVINSIVKYYYANNIDQPIIIETIINLGIIKNYSCITSEALKNKDFNTMKLLINDENANYLLNHAIGSSNTELTIYIVNNFEYDENIIINALVDHQLFLKNNMIEVLETIIINNKNKK